jgi:hypothetical protein
MTGAHVKIRFNVNPADTSNLETGTKGCSRGIPRVADAGDAVLGKASLNAPLEVGKATLINGQSSYGTS